MPGNGDIIRGASVFLPASQPEERYQDATERACDGLLTPESRASAARAWTALRALGADEKQAAMVITTATALRQLSSKR